MQAIVKQSLNNSVFQSKPAEEWNSEQVATWITHIGFEDSLADIFRDQEITGDILLELTVESLKELEVDTFGKRFKLHAAITALKNESNDNNSSLRSESPTKKGSVSYFNVKQPYADDDIVSNYSAVIRNSQISSANEPRASLDSLRSNRKNSLNSSDICRSQSLTSKSIVLERKNTINKNIQENNHNLQNPDSNKLHTVIPSTAMVRRSEDIPVVHETSLTPDMEGWLYKQGDRYKNWNKRWFVLKGNNLFYFKSPKAVRMKGIVNLKGYRVLVDSSIQAGKYCFKVQHEKERTFFFYTDHEKCMKEWIKAMMKATIERNYNAPVMSSSTIPTVSLEAARKMRPRPPSALFLQKGHPVHIGLPSMEEEYIPSFGQSLTSPPASVMTRSPPTSIGTRSPSLMTQGMRITDNTSDYSLEYPRTKNDSGFNSHLTTLSPTQSLTHSSSDSSTTTKNSLSLPAYKSPSVNISFYPHEEDENLIDPENTDILGSSRSHLLFSDDMPSSRHFQPTPYHYRESSAKRREYIDWVNIYIEDEIDDLSDLSAGEVLLELLECLSNKEIKRTPVKIHQSDHSQMISAFEYMRREGIILDGNYTFRDILSGNETKIMSLLDSIKEWHNISLSSGITLPHFPKFTINKKTASGGTFGEEEQTKLRTLDDQDSIIV